MPYGSVEPPTRIWLSVVATAGGTASGVHAGPVGYGVPSSRASGCPFRSRISVTGRGSHCVPSAPRVEYALARASGLVATAPRV